MSTKNGSTLPPYISRVRLKGYKSIIDTKVDLHPGLNIIIGPNGSGKTNFLEFLSKLFKFNFPDNIFESSIDLFLGTGLKTWKAQRKKITSKISTKELIIPPVSQKIYEKGNKKILSKDIKELIDSSSRATFIPFTLPRKMVGFDSKLSLEISVQNFSLNINGISSYPKFISEFVFNNFFGSNSDEFLTNRDLFLERLTISDELKRNLRKFSPIKQIRVDKGFTVKKKHFSYFINLEFEFLVEDSWLSWDMLSDGTKRLFYIISEVTLTKGICLIEEPEIGIHPDQYRKILNFLKEQSEDKQIIITTHAPRTLDILKDNELNKIILTRFDKELGTKMRHLKKKEIKHAVQYRENDGSTSELWTYTGFFDEEEAI